MAGLITRKPRKQHKELIGKKFGKLTVQTLLGYVSKPYGKKTIHEPVYSLLCDCGNTTTLKRVDFKYGNTKSCGCLRNEIVYERFANNRSVSDIVFYKNQIMNSYIRRANSKDREFKLTYEEFDTLLKGNCFYCGVSPSTPYVYQRKNVELLYNGVDRVNPSLGYTLENSVSCCKTCNFLKGTLAGEEFLDQVEKIALHCGLSQRCELNNRAKSVEAETADTEVTYN